MLTAAQQRASDLIWKLWQAGETTPELPEALRPSTRSDGYAIQAGLDSRSRAKRFGWKIAATSVAGQKHIGVSGPMAGRILQEQVLPANARVSIARNLLRVAEPEFAFRMSRGLPARSAPYSVEEVMAAVGDLHLAIEVPDTRFANFVTVGEPSLIADDACSHQLLVGPAVTADWRAIDLARHEVTATIRGRGTRAGVGSNVLGDPRDALSWIANELSGLGIGLAAGETITTGTCMVPIELRAGDQIVADFGVLSTISIEIE